MSASGAFSSLYSLYFRLFLVTCVGGIQIGNETTIHTSAVINHKVIVEDNVHVGACSFVIRRVKAGTTVFGNPAKKLV